MAPGTQGTRPAGLEEMLKAKDANIERFKQSYINGGLPEKDALAQANKDAMLLSFRTLVGEEGAVAGNILTKIEGVGTKQLGDAFAKRTIDFMNKFRSIALESKRLGDPEATTIAKLTSNLSTSEQAFAAKIMKDLTEFNSSPLGKIDKAATTLRGFKDLAEQKLLAQYRQSMKAFEGDEFYGQFKNLGNNEVTPNGCLTS